jgi:hypothetical protein
MSLRKFGFLLIVFFLVLSLVACPTEPPAGDGDDDSLEMVTLSGVFTGIDNDGFLLIATDTVTAFTYATPIGDDRSFNLEVPKDHACVYAVVDENGRARTVMVFADNSASASRIESPTTEVITGLKLSEDHAFPGTITLPDASNPGMIELEIAPDLLDTTVTARLKDGELLGFDDEAKFGKADFTFFDDTFGRGGKADPDGDGLPSVIDADDDGDGIPDDWDKDADGDGVEDSLEEDSKPVVNFSLGFLLDIRENSGVRSYDSSSDDYGRDDALRRDMRMDFQVRFQNATDFASVQSVRLYVPSSPAYAVLLDAVEFKQEGEGFATYTFANGSTFTPLTASIEWADFTDDTGYGYNIPENLTDPNTYTVSVKIPQNQSPYLFEVGDVFTVEIQYADGGVEYVSQMINYTYTNGTQFHGYTMTVGETPDSVLSNYSLFDFSSDAPNQIEFDDTDSKDTLQFVFIPPKDEDGDHIIPDETDGSADSGFRIELFANPEVDGPDAISRSWNSEHNRFDSMLSLLERIDEAGEVYFVGIVPLSYLKALVDLADSDPDTDTFEMEYFLNFTEDSFIKNRLRFKLVDNTPVE